MKRKLLSLAFLAFAFCGLFGCSHPKSPAGRVAWDFMDAYYVKADLQGAQRYCDGVALEKVQADAQLRDGLTIDKSAHHPRVTFKPLDAETAQVSSDEAIFFYKVVVKPEMASEIEKKTRVKVRQREGNVWKVTQFSDVDLQ